MTSLKGVLSFAVRLAINDLTLLVNYALIKRLSSTSSIYVLQLSIKAGLLGGTIPFCPRFWPNSTISFPKVPSLGLRSMLIFLAGLLGEAQFHLISSPPASVLILSSLMRPKKRILVMELTIPFEKNIKDAHNRKLERYGSLVADIRSVGYKVELSCVEIGSRGLITNDNKTRVKTIFKSVGSKAHRSFFRDVAKNVLLCSYALWNCRHEPLWVECPYIKV